VTSIQDLRSQGTDDIVTVLLDQHERIKTAMSQVADRTGEAKQEAFDDLRRLLAVHETAEELILRPVTRSIGSGEIAQARLDEEKAASQTLSDLESMGSDDPRFDGVFAGFRADVLRHAQAEESLEFPQIVQHKDANERSDLGRTLLAAEKVAPTHPHPSTAGSTTAQAVVGPFAAMVDRVRDALSRHSASSSEG